MARPDLDPIEIEALERQHQQQLERTYRLYGQHNGINEPDSMSSSPFVGIHNALRGLVAAFVIATISLLLIALAVSSMPGPTP